MAKEIEAALEEDDITPAEQRRMLVEEIRGLNKILEAEEWNQTGRVGQPRPHWALTARRAALESLRKLDRQSPPDADAPDELAAFLEE